MKKQLFIITSLISSISFGQSLTQANEPAIGQSIQMYVCDTTVSNLATVMGNNVTWDYSNIVSDGGATSLIDIVSASQTTNGAFFQNSTKAISFQGALLNYISSTPTQRLSQGFVFNDAVLGDVVADFNANSEKVVAYPFSLGNSVTDNFNGTISFTFNGALQTPACTGNSLAKIDGQGMLKLPSNTNLSNVIRYVLVDTIFTQVAILPPPFPASDIQIIRKQFEYYNLTATSLPVFVFTSIDVVQSGSLTPLVSQKNILSSVQPTNTSGLNEQDKTTFLIYPNPTNGELNIIGSFNGSTSLSVIDQTGRIVLSKNTIKAAEILDLSSLNKGMYTVLFQSDDSVSSQKIILE
jgi:hypothetical protein